MKKLLSLTLGLLALGALAVGSGPAHAQTTAPGPYYATPSWDQQLACTSTVSCPRFIVLSNWVDASNPSGGAAVLDRETGLVWEKSPSADQVPWGQARAGCLDKNVGGRKGWRLPSINELMSLVDPSASNPSLPAGHPFTVLSAGYWSATAQIPASANQVYAVNFSTGGIGTSAASLRAWCVRGGGILENN
jgi:hypothetical protein